jgi:hypothetical protein
LYLLPTNTLPLVAAAGHRFKLVIPFYGLESREWPWQGQHILDIDEGTRGNQTHFLLEQRVSTEPSHLPHLGMFDRGTSTSPLLIDFSVDDMPETFDVTKLSMRRVSFQGTTKRSLYDLLASAHDKHGNSFAYAFLADDIKGSVTKIRGTGALYPEVTTAPFEDNSLIIVVEVEATAGAEFPNLMLLRLHGTNGIFEQYIKTKVSAFPPDLHLYGPSDTWPTLGALRPRRHIMYSRLAGTSSFPFMGIITSASVTLVENSSNVLSSTAHLDYAANVHEVIVFHTLSNSCYSGSQNKATAYYKGRPNKPAPLNRRSPAIIKLATNFPIKRAC